VVNKIIIGAILTAVFVGLAEQMRISEDDSRYDRCLQAVERAEWQCQDTGVYPNGTAGPVSVLDPCKTYAQDDRARCATAAAAR
tara:strand:+ start:352 stop:603 length:252 start_codon:yes stop_codon:yes gene_type:complete